MNIIIKNSAIQFRNPQIGQPTRAIEAHYSGRRVEAYVDNDERMFRFEKDELPFDSDEQAIINAIEQKVQEENTPSE